MQNIIHPLVAALSGVIGVLYLLNIGAGIIELIPDNIPYLGNLDEAGAVALVLYCIRYFRNRKKD